MKRSGIIRTITVLAAVSGLVLISACGRETVSGTVTNAPKTSVTARQKAEPVPSSVNMSESSENTELYYSSDGSVHLWVDYGSETAAIVDGSEVIPVDIALGAYGPYIERMKFNDSSKFLIAECEGTGTGICMYGLCIVAKEADTWMMTRYDSAYFTDILNDRIKTEYRENYHDISISVDGKQDPNVDGINLDPDKQDKEAGKFVSFSWSDIINIELIDGEVWLSAPAGFVYANRPMPDYDISLNATALITVNSDNSIEVGGIELNYSGEE